MPTKRPNHSRKKRPPATRLEGAQCLGGLPDSDINAIVLVASASRRHGWPDLIEDVCRMPRLVRAKIGELLLQISEADDEERDRAQRAADAERERAQYAAGLRAGRMRLLARAVEEGGGERAMAYALAMSPGELAAWRARPLGYGDPIARNDDAAVLAHP